MSSITIDGRSLTIDQVIQAANHPEVRVELAKNAISTIQRSAEAVANFVKTGQVAYGITTGFGAFKDN